MRFCVPFFAVAAVLSLGGVARAEKIYLKNGFDIEGWIVEESKAEVIVAIIKHGTIGKLTIDPAEIEQIDRTRRESIEEALERYKREQAERAAALAKVQPAAPTATAQPEAGAAPAAGAAPPAGEGATPPAGTVEKPAGEVTIPVPTPEQEEKIQAGIDGIGDTRRAGGAATRRDNALHSLIEVGPAAIPAIVDATGDANWYRRMNAARAIAGIAREHRDLRLYENAVPAMLKLISDSNPHVRTAANEALEAISGQRVGFEPASTEELQPSELAVIDRWKQWWEGAKATLKK